MSEYITVKDVSFGEYSEKHSRFLGFLMACENESQAQNLINEKRKEYWDARHTVYAYILSDGTARFSDDGEPHGTAGKPVLDVLSNSGIKNALLVVVRYFGGILLGTGGLVRAYSAAASKAIENCKRVRIVPGDIFSVNLSYGEYEKLKSILKVEIRDVDFSDNVTVRFAVKESEKETMLIRIKDAFSSSVLPKFEEKTEIYEEI